MKEIEDAGAVSYLQNGLKHIAIRLANGLNCEAQRVNLNGWVIGCTTGAIARPGPVGLDNESRV